VSPTRMLPTGTERINSALPAPDTIRAGADAGLPRAEHQPPYSGHGTALRRRHGNCRVARWLLRELPEDFAEARKALNDLARTVR
jgi:hypothetical protein